MSFKFNALTGGFNTFTQADLTSIGGSNDLSFNDNAKIKLGTGNDLELHHDGSHSYLSEVGTGSLFIDANSGIFIRGKTGEESIIANADGAVLLYYDNSKKLESISTGVRATGNYQLPFADGNTGLRDKLQWVTEASYFDEVAYISVNRTAVSGAPSDMVFATGTVGSVSEKLKITSSGNVQIPNDSGKLQLGTSQDLQIYHNGSTSYIKDTGTGNLRLATSKGEFRNAGDTENLAAFTENGGVELYYDNSLMLDVKSWGVEINGDLGLDDNRKVALGNGPDLLLYHDGSASLIENATGNLALRAKTAENSIVMIPDDKVALFHDNSKKFETHSGGVSVFGNLSLTDADGYELRLGASSDLKLYHNGSHSYIEDSGTGTLRIQSSQMNVLKADGSETMATFVADGGVSLYYDNALKLQTNTLGVSVGTTDTVIYDHNISDSYESGVVLDGAGSVQVARYNDQCLLLNRMGLDGTIESFYNDGTYVGGIAVSGSTTVYATSSDYRLKENVTAISDGITRLKTLKPYRFNFISDTTKTVDGFFAHEVTAVPEAIVGEKDAEEMQSLDYAKLTPLLTAALQEAITKIETLETKVAALEAA